MSYTKNNGTTAGDVIIEETKKVPMWAYSNTVINNLTVRPGVEIIGQLAFQNTKIEGKSVFPSTLYRLEKGAFFGLEANELELPEGLKVVDEGSLNFRSVETLIIPASLTTYNGVPFYAHRAKTIIIRLSEKGENLTGIVNADYDASTDCDRINIVVIVPEGDLTQEADEAIKKAQAMYPHIEIIYSVQSEQLKH